MTKEEKQRAKRIRLGERLAKKLGAAHDAVIDAKSLAFDLMEDDPNDAVLHREAQARYLSMAKDSIRMAMNAMREAK